MCDVCTAIEARGDRPFEDLTLVTKSIELAEAYATILRETGKGRPDADGVIREAGEPYADGTTVVIPFSGNPAFAVAVAETAVHAGIADHTEGQALVDREEADVMGITVEELVARRAEQQAQEAETPEQPGMPAGVRALLEALGGAAGAMRGRG